MEILQIKKQDALTAYGNADQKGKTLLSDLFGKDLLPAIARIKSFHDACKETGVDINAFETAHNALPGDVVAYMKLRLIAEALNEGWKADWLDENQRKYYPWFDTSNGGFQFHGVDAYYQYSAVSSRLCFKSSELAKYAARQFGDEYQSFLNG